MAVSPSARRKRLGQHFLRHPGALRRIVAAAALQPTDTVVEVGAGTGILTVALAPEAGKVLAVEVDGHLIPRLKERLAEHAATNVEVIQEDILRFDFAQAAHRFGRLKVVGNLPYSVSSPVMFRLLEHRELIILAVLMFQREVAERIAAAAGGKEYGVLSVRVQQAALVERVMDLEEKHFQPPPKVKSAVLKLTFPEQPPQPVADEEVFALVVKAAFGQRRKTLHNALRSLGLPAGAADEAMAASGVDPALRAERLSVAAFARLADELAARGQLGCGRIAE
jgi:16S rRNA (adenine1518-N6/adenine1519-N6)-dimethyltransferase